MGIDKSDITPRLVRELLSYDSETGVLTWRKRMPRHYSHTSDPVRFANAFNARHAGTEAFTATTGNRRQYRVGAIFTHSFQAHRVAWCHHHGKWPNDLIDHNEAATGSAFDNRIENLSDVTHKENNKNVSRPKDNKSGVPGVFWSESRQRYMAYINVNKKRIYLGRFRDFDAAVSARKAAERKHGFNVNHGKAVPEKIAKG